MQCKLVAFSSCSSIVQTISPHICLDLEKDANKELWRCMFPVPTAGASECGPTSLQGLFPLSLKLSFNVFFHKNLLSSSNRIFAEVTLTSPKISCSFLTWTGGSLEIGSCSFHKIRRKSSRPRHRTVTALRDKMVSPDVSSTSFWLEKKETHTFCLHLCQK